jgi:hypothetical protein
LKSYLIVYYLGTLIYKTFLFVFFNLFITVYLFLYNWKDSWSKFVLLTKTD